MGLSFIKFYYKNNNNNNENKNNEMNKEINNENTKMNKDMIRELCNYLSFRDYFYFLSTCKWIHENAKIYYDPLYYKFKWNKAKGFNLNDECTKASRKNIKNKKPGEGFWRQVIGDTIIPGKAIYKFRINFDRTDANMWLVCIGIAGEVVPKSPDYGKWFGGNRTAHGAQFGYGTFINGTGYTRRDKYNHFYDTFEGDRLFHNKLLETDTYKKKEQIEVTMIVNLIQNDQCFIVYCIDGIYSCKYNFNGKDLRWYPMAACSRGYHSIEIL